MSPSRAKPKAAGRKSARGAAKRGAAKRAATRRTATRAAKRGAAKRAAKRRAATKPAKRGAVKKATARRAAPKRATKAAPKRARRAGKAATRGAARKAARAGSARRATLHLVTRPAAKPAAPRGAKQPAAPRHRPFGGAIEGASAKDLALFDLVRARVEIQAAVQGMLAASAEVPVAEGKWNPRQIVLHLHYWDREMLPYVEPAWRENRRPPHTRDEILAENESSQRELGAHDWEEARRLMQQSRETLLETLQSVPEEPAAMWSAEHALGWLIRILSNHDRHHAAVLKAARTRTAE